MKRNRRIGMLAVAMILAVAAFVTSTTQGMWRQPTDAPAARLLKNVAAYIKTHPRDANGYYILGRLHSLLFAIDTKTIDVYEKSETELPSLAPYQSILVENKRGKVLSKVVHAHLLDSIRNYRRATELDPNLPSAWLGLGWMLESGAAWAPPGDAKTGRNAEGWKKNALAAYRKAYSLSISGDLKRGSLGPGANSAISLEAAQGILRIFGKRPLNPAETEEAEKLRGAIARIEQMPRVVTPIVFPFSQSDRPGSLDDLLAQNKIVKFDLDGDGRTEWWPWVSAGTGILVWDPKGKGRIESGLQLFGSVTWWMSWRNGYEPLASLDDNRDGTLRGSELNGIAVWQDRNGNGISDPGEVVPVASRGIIEIAVTPGPGKDALWNAAGIRWKDGRQSPTYDWAPTEARPLAQLNQNK
jgi:hypothetical protein